MSEANIYQVIAISKIDNSQIRRKAIWVGRVDNGETMLVRTLPKSKNRTKFKEERFPTSDWTFEVFKRVDI